MASRDDVDIFWHLSPRLIFVRDPSDNINIQDLHDTLRDKESEVQNLIYPSIVSTAGGESLGGGVTVGLTSTLQNARVGFQARREWTVSGLVSSTDLTGDFLIDSSADFTTSGVNPGSWIVNLTDGSICTVLNIDSSTQIATDGLGGGILNQFTTNDQYKILDVTQTEVDGGNLVSLDTDGFEIDAIFPTAGVQVVRTSASSATTQSQQQLEHSTFNGVVTVDVINGQLGTGYPRGTQQIPVNNFQDARTIALERGFSKISIIGDCTIGAGDNVEGFTIIGENATRTTITILDSAATAGVQVDNATVTGVFDTEASFANCTLVNIQFVKADINNCVLQGEITLSGTGTTSIYNSSDGIVSAAPPPSINFNGAGRSLAIRNYDGDLELNNKSGPEDVEINMSTGGSITIASDVTDGTLRLTGIIEVIDNSTGSAVIDTSHVIFPDLMQLAAFNGHIFINTISGVSETKFPAGTHQVPVNNLADALTIAGVRGIDHFLLAGQIVVTSGTNLDGYTVGGQNPINSQVILLSGVSTNRTSFNACLLTGEINGPVLCRDVALQNITGLGSDDFPSLFERCITRNGFMSIRNGLTTPQNIHFINCYSGIPGEGSLTFDMNNCLSSVNFREYNGGISIVNWTGGQQSTISFADGQLNLDSSCTSGTLSLDGRVRVTDNSTLTIIERSRLHPENISKRVWEEPLSTQTDTDTIGGYIANKVLTIAKFLGIK